MSSLKVFVSATSADLAAARQVVKEALLTIGCHPIEQTNFPLDWRDVQTMLRERITDCQALIHVAGLRYGAEPDPATLPQGAPRRSYTQMEYDVGRELQQKRGDKRFRVYTIVCSKDFPYGANASPETVEKEILQQQHRDALLEGGVLYETPVDLDALEKRVLALREEVITLRVAENRRTQLTLAGIVLIVIALAGIGYGLYRLSVDAPRETVQQLLQFDEELVGSTLRKKIKSIYQREVKAARAAGRNYEAILALERQRDAALAQVDDTLRTIKHGLAGDPSPVFTEASYILEREGVDAAIAYLESHTTDQLARAERAAAQARVAQEKLQRELQLLFFLGQLHESRLEWDEALALLKKVVKTAPQSYEARMKLSRLMEILGRYPEAEAETSVALVLARTPNEKALALNNLANMARILRGDYDKARDFHEQALAILGAVRSGNLDQKRRLAQTLNDLGALLTEMEYCKAARHNLERALRLRREVLAATVRGDHQTIGVDQSKLAETLANLARVSLLEDVREDARRHYRESIKEAESAFGTRLHPWLLATRGDLATMLMGDFPYDEARIELETLIEDTEKVLGEHHWQLAPLLNNLAFVYLLKNRPAEAEAKAMLASEINTKSFGPDHPRLAPVYTAFAEIYREQKRYSEAEEYYLRALKITKRWGKSHSDYLKAAGGYVSLLRQVNRSDEAKAFEATLPQQYSETQRSCRLEPSSSHQP